MENVSLSYILTTRNKLSYLKEVLPALIEAKLPDEEILIADGASTDGTAEYLRELYAQKKIDFFISEPDRGEAHGFNKLMARAQGIVIKLVTDDDAFYYPGIRACKDFMLAHPEIDFLSTDGFKRRNHTVYHFIPMLYQSQFETWQRKYTPFAFCGLGIMIRRSSLPLLGYLHTGFVRVDAEYALRVTASKATLAWYTSECFGHILNQDSNSITQVRKITEEMERLEGLYLGKHVRSPLEQKFRTLARHVKNWIQNKRTSPKPGPEAHVVISEWAEMFRSSVAHLAENAKHNKGTFLYGK